MSCRRLEHGDKEELIFGKAYNMEVKLPYLDTGNIFDQPLYSLFEETSIDYMCPFSFMLTLIFDRLPNV